MTKAKEIKGVVLCENFNKQFIDLIKKLEYPPELEKYLKYFESEDVTDLSVNLFNSDDFGKLALCDFEVFTSGFDSYSYHIHFNFDDDVRIIIIDRLNNYNILFDVSLQFNGFKWDYLFILPNSDKETISEPEQPVEDAEEQENPELTPAEEDKQEFELYESVEMPLCVFQLMQDKVNAYIDDNDIIEKYGGKDIPCGVVVKIEHNMSKPSYKCDIYDDLGEEAEQRSSKIEPLTQLEQVIFEEIENCYERYNEYSELVKVAEYGAEYNGESAEEINRYGHLANEQIFNSDYLKELISKAGLDETYQAWLAERKKQEAVGVK